MEFTQLKAQIVLIKMPFLAMVKIFVFVMDMANSVKRYHHKLLKSFNY